MKRLMREKGVKKVSGSSWIELQSNIHAFNATDHSHPNCREIYKTLKEIYSQIKISENDCILNGPLDDIDLANGCWVVDADGLIREVQV